MSKWDKDQNNNKLSFMIGVVLGIGLLTKAFFIPIISALGAFLLVRTLKSRNDAAALSAYQKNLMLSLLPALLIGGGWYVYKYMTFGTLIGSTDDIALANHGGLIANLKQNFSLYAILRGLIVTFASYSWAGTWSLARLPILLQLPLFMLSVWLFAAYVMQLKQRPFTDPAWLTIWLFGMFEGGFIYHAIVGVALSGNGQTPGWYLHILMPWVAPAIGIGGLSLLQNPITKLFLVGLLFYAVLFQITAIWSQLSLFTGCAIKGDDKSYVFSDRVFCLDQVSSIMDHLSIIGWPVLAMIGFSGGIICILMTVFLWKREAKGALPHYLR